ncbi:MAG: zinc ribbon domain-containing protein [Thermoplasmataceae archaeon]
MIRCPSCGSSMPDGSLFCQKCGSRLQVSAPDHGFQSQPEKVAPASGSLFVELQHKLGRSDVSAHPVSGLPGMVSGENNLLIVSPGPSLLMVQITSTPTPNTWEDMVKAKFRMGSDIAVAIISDGIKLKTDATLQAQLAKSGIFTVSASAFMDKVHGITFSGGWQSTVDQIMGIIGLNRDGDRMIYSVQQTRFALIPDSVRDKLKKWMGRNNSP